MVPELAAPDPAASHAKVRPALLPIVVSHAFEITCVIIFAALLCSQLFIPPFVGMANNSDFHRILSPLSMGTERPINADPYQMNLNYFVSDYTTAPRWQGGLWMFSSELPMVWICREAARLITGGPHFDIRYFGALNASILLVAFSVALAYLRGQPTLTRYLIPLLLIIIFTDSTYICPLNSFYMDAVSIVFLLCTVVFAFQVAQSPAGLKGAVALVFSAVLLITSKPQHALIGLPASAMILWFAYRARRSPSGAVLLCGAIALSIVTPLMARTPAIYQSAAGYNMFFLKIAKLSPDPMQVLAYLGLPPAAARLIGTSVYDVTPGFDKGEILKKATFQAARRYYLLHPKLMLTVFDTDLRRSTYPIRMPFASYRQEDGFPPWSQPRHHRIWGRLRSKLNQLFPYNLALLYLGLLLLLCSPRFRRHELFPVAAFLLIAGCLEFAIASLGDGLDMPRHLTIFHAVTEVIIVFWVGGMLNLIQPWFDRLRQS